METLRAPAPVCITSGDPAGIGPDLVLQLGQHVPSERLVILGDIDLLAQRARTLNPTLTLRHWQPGQPVQSHSLQVYHCPAHPDKTGDQVQPGVPDPATAHGTLTMLERATQGCLTGTFSAMVTAPIAKSVICDGAQPGFTGHTEFLAHYANVDQVVMMLAAGALRVALATTHLPLRNVADAIQPASLATTLRILHHDLVSKFGLSQPRILVLGLNPHAGENGHMGDEEQRIITPVLTQLRETGMQLTGPVPADTAFTPHVAREQDAVLAMYHDQGLPVLKYAGFGEAVNITLGLPFIRTSVDHGTAFDLAGTGRASCSSLIAATQLALQLADRTQPPVSPGACHD